MIKPYLNRDNPWELVVFAAMLFIPAYLWCCRSLRSRLQDSYSPARNLAFVYIVGMSCSGAHIFGSVAITLSVFCVVLYFYLGRASPEGG